MITAQLLLCALLQIYRNFEFGKLMKLIMLDTRIIGRSLQDYNKSTVRFLHLLPCLCTLESRAVRTGHVSWPVLPPAAVRCGTLQHVMHTRSNQCSQPRPCQYTQALTHKPGLSGLLSALLAHG